MNCALILSFCWPKNLKIIWKFSFSQYRCHITPIDVENCVKSALNSNHRKQNFTVNTIWGGGDYQLRCALAAKQIWVAVITIWGTLDSLPPPIVRIFRIPILSPENVQFFSTLTQQKLIFAWKLWKKKSLDKIKCSLLSSFRIINSD